MTQADKDALAVEQLVDEWMGRSVERFENELRARIPFEVEIPKPVYYNAATGENETVDQMNTRWAYDQRNSFCFK